MSLSEIIREKIKLDGPISFHHFMEMALYYPDLGYYTSLRDKIGKHADYYTSSDFTSLFGVMVGKQIEEMWSILNEQPFSIVEYGAGMGFLCRDILHYLANNKKLYGAIRYCIIEKSAAMREKQKFILNEKVSWHNSIFDIPEIAGCVLSNEVLDNFSVHRVVMEDDLMEIFVDYENDFGEIIKPAPPALKNYLDELKINLSNGFHAEINLEAINWISDIAASLKKGFVITIDYGYPSSELYVESRRSGTLMCYSKHSVNDQPYIDIGEQDITAHVNFSALVHWGEKNGLECCGFTDQRHFLQGLGLADYLRKLEQSASGDLKINSEKVNFLHTLLMDMGSKFKVLIQQKGLKETNLSGLTFARQIN
ncbi:MAG: SAM-dependent methyltransferase [Chitinophagales bacterium]|nr:SAM-dependent methyltransferase [Chitinophagales bacterium]